jgi:hypothetical protein
MVDRQKLSSRLSALEGYLAELRGFRRGGLRDLERFAAAMAELL